MNPLQKLLNNLAPFLMLGIALVAFAFGIVILAYLFLIGAVVGIVLFTINWLRQKFSARKSASPAKKEGGRTIDSDDWKVL